MVHKREFGFEFLNLLCQMFLLFQRDPSEQGLMGNYLAAEEYREWGLRWQAVVTQPIIGAINGYCLGRGFEYALHSDILIASDRAAFGAPEIRHGSIAATRLPFFVSAQWAKRIILTGDHVSAETAERIGLVVDVVPHEELMDAALSLAQRFAHIPPFAVRFNKRMIDGTQVRKRTVNLHVFRDPASDKIQTVRQWRLLYRGSTKLVFQEGPQATINTKKGTFFNSELSRAL